MDRIEARTSWPHVHSALTYIALGGLLGLASSWAWPGPIFRGSHISGLSIALVPISVAILMVLLGRWRLRKGKTPAGLFTFWLAFDCSFAFMACRLASQVGWLAGPH